MTGSRAARTGERLTHRLTRATHTRNTPLTCANADRLTGSYGEAGTRPNARRRAPARVRARELEVKPGMAWRDNRPGMGWNGPETTDEGRSDDGAR